MFSKVEHTVSRKNPIVMAAFAAVVFVFFGVLGNSADVTWQFTKADALWALPNFVISSSLVGIVVGVLLAAITAVSFVLVARRVQPPLWLSLIFGLLAVIALLSWLAAGNTIQFAFIMSNAIVLAVPIALGAMGGIMSERVGVVNIAIEGQLLTGAFLAAVVGSLTDNLWLGLLAAMIGAALMSMVLAAFSIKYLVDQVIVGVVLNVLVIGITNFLYSQWLAQDGQNSNFPERSTSSRFRYCPRFLCWVPRCLQTASPRTSRSSSFPHSGSSCSRPNWGCALVPWANTPWPPTLWVSM